MKSEIRSNAVAWLLLNILTHLCCLPQLAFQFKLKLLFLHFAYIQTLNPYPQFLFYHPPPLQCSTLSELTLTILPLSRLTPLQCSVMKHTTRRIRANQVLSVFHPSELNSQVAQGGIPGIQVVLHPNIYLIRNRTLQWGKVFAVLRLLYHVCCFTFANSLDFGIAGKFTFAGLRLLVYILSRDEHCNGGGNGGGPTYSYTNTKRF